MMVCAGLIFAGCKTTGSSDCPSKKCGDKEMKSSCCGKKTGKCADKAKGSCCKKDADAKCGTAKSECKSM